MTGYILALTLAMTTAAAEKVDIKVVNVPPPVETIETVLAPPVPYMPAPIPGQANNPLPRSNPGSWVTTSDYPSVMLRLEAQGTTGFLLKVGNDGRVTECTISASSGYKELDDATCINMVRRARFYPAQNEKGQPVEGSYQNRVSWRIPRDIGGTTSADFPQPPRNFGVYATVERADYPPKALLEKRSGTAKISLEIDALGEIAKCTVKTSSGHPDLDDASCAMAHKKWVFEPAKDLNGQPTPGRIERYVFWRSAQFDAQNTAAMGARIPQTFQMPHPSQFFPRPPIVTNYRWNIPEVGDYPEKLGAQAISGTTKMTLTIGSDGEVADCAVTSSSGNNKLDEAACKMARTKAAFRPALGADAKPTIGKAETGVNWATGKLPGDAFGAPAQPKLKQNPLAQTGEVLAEIQFSSKGLITGCKIVVKGISALTEKVPSIEQGLCRDISRDFARFEPIKDAQGNPVARKVIVKLQINHEDVNAVDSK